MSISLGVLRLEIHLPGCNSLKEKRSRLKPLLARLHKQFNVSAAEVDHNDIWQSAVIACSLVSNDPNHTRRSLEKIPIWIENNRPEVTVMDDHIELI